MIIKNLIVIICSLVACTEGFLRKATLFLQTPYIEGDPPMKPDIDPVSMRYPGAIKVLFGHYSSIVERRTDKSDSIDPVGVSKTQGKPLIGSNVKLPAVKTISKVLDVYKKNLKKVIDNALNTTKESKSAEYKEIWDGCQDELEKCLKLPESYLKCAIHCLTKGHPVLESLTNLIDSLVERLCQPKHTIFDQIFKYKGKNFAQFRKFHVFLEAFRASKRAIGDVAQQMVRALGPIIIDKLPTDMMPLREVTKELEISLTDAEISQPLADTFISNGLCLSIDDRAALVKLMDLLYKDLNLADALLEGLTAMNLVTKYIPGNFQVPFASTAEGIRLLTGTICGLIPTAMSDTKINCDNLGGFPTSGVPLPEAPGIPVDAECVDSEVANWVTLQVDTDVESNNPFQLPPSIRKTRASSPKDGKPGVIDEKESRKDGAGEMKSESGSGESGSKKRSTLKVGEKSEGKK